MSGFPIVQFFKIIMLAQIKMVIKFFLFKNNNFVTHNH